MNIPGLTYDDGFKKGRDFGVKEIRDLAVLVSKFPQVDTPEKLIEEIDKYIALAEKERENQTDGKRQIQVDKR